MVSRRMLLEGLLVLSFAGIAGCASTASQESTGELFDDSWITTRVKAAILEEPTLKSLDVHVETAKGEVHLSGTVESDENLRKAATLARAVKGVRGVRNDLRVKARQP